ncbi:MAG: MBL fold metallo-hydrolase [Deltaproteobacteria bacterium]|nr:MBL fold metallo-hydrolase [Deltaproteobacteria bacterium]
MKITFWGVRGSIPCPGPETVRYGGNTPCLELRVGENGRLIIIDAGSGMRPLGHRLMEDRPPGKALEADVYLTHTHWDHIMGLPFFPPLYHPETRLRIHGPVTYEDESLEEILGGQLTYRYFPVRQAELAAGIEYHTLKEGRFDLGGGVSLVTKYLNHPILCLGYRFEYRGKVLCTAYDTEPFRNIFCTDPSDPAYDEAMAREGDQVAREENERVEEFFKGADLLIHDAQYTLAEYETTKTGWGHSAMEHAVNAAARAGVKRLALFHHEPLRTDAELDELSETLRPRGKKIDVFFAREGMQIHV